MSTLNHFRTEETLNDESGSQVGLVAYDSTSTMWSIKKASPITFAGKVQYAIRSNTKGFAGDKLVNMQIDGKIKWGIPYNDALHLGYWDYYDMEEIQSHSSTWTTCFNCSTYQETHVKQWWNWIPWAICILMFFTGFWICCLFPLFAQGLKTTNHYCKNCGILLA